MTWSAVVLGATAVVGLGADVLIAGPDVAVGTAGVIVGFCEVGALVLGVVGWARDHQEAGHRPNHEDTRVAREEADRPVPPEIPGKYVVDARHARGVQVGDGNTQHNDFRRPETAGDPDEVDS